jgi:putative flippase GtrA
MIRETGLKLLRYGLTAGTAAIVDAGGFAILIGLGFSPAPSAVSSFVVAVLVNYWLSSRYVFGDVRSIPGFALFFAVALLGLSVNVGVTLIAIYQFGVMPILGKILGIGIAFLVNFALNLRIVFRKGS